jgi:hypothetical protein
VISAFLRITTNPRAFPIPFDIDEATDVVNTWLEHPRITLLLPTEDHWTVFRAAIVEAQANAALIMDAHLAALAIEHGATLATTDRDFLRFSKLKTVDPLR